ncbi:MAG TPA: CotH kinase family protein, partial [Verrucomicrobiae bacterium]
LGFYTVIEGFGKDFLGRYFKNTKGNLYDGGFLQEVNGNLERDTGGGPNDRADLKALIAAAQEPDPMQRWARLDKVLDLDRFVSYLAMEILTWDWDGYPLNRNNYRIYHDPATDKLIFLPHGMDQMFQNPGASALRPNFNGLVAAAVLKTPQGRQLYKQRVGTLFTNVYQIEVLTNKLAGLHARNRAALAGISEKEASDYDGQIRATRDRMVQRWHSVALELSLPEPVPLPFTNGIATLITWRVAEERPAEKGHARLERVKDSDGRRTLSIVATTNTTASWRCKILLEGGRYRFEGMARAAQIVPLPIKALPQPQPEQNQNQTAEKKGEGAGLRISGTQKPRENKIMGDGPWTKLKYEFDVVPPNDEVELVCELRAITGQVWFDSDSLRLVKVLPVSTASGPVPGPGK